MADCHACNSHKKEENGEMGSQCVGLIFGKLFYHVNKEHLKRTP